MECEKVGVHLNANKTEYMTYNIGDHTPLKTNGDALFNRVNDLEFLGSRIESAETDITT